MRYYAVVDTNILVSALLSKKDDAATVQVFQRILGGDVIPLYSNETMTEYREVLARRKFKFDNELSIMFYRQLKNLACWLRLRNFCQSLTVKRSFISIKHLSCQAGAFCFASMRALFYWR